MVYILWFCHKTKMSEIRKKEEKFVIDFKFAHIIRSGKKGWKCFQNNDNKEVLVQWNKKQAEFSSGSRGKVS